jgi:phage gp36-like protein
MAYATRSDIEAIYGVRQLETLLAPDVDMDGAIGRALDDAEHIINAYLSRRYAIPLSTVPGIIRSATIDVACWKLAPAADRLSEEISRRAKFHLDFLKDVAAGKADIPELEEATASSGSVVQSDAGAAFSAQTRRSDARRTL